MNPQIFNIVKKQASDFFCAKKSFPEQTGTLPFPVSSLLRLNWWMPVLALLNWTHYYDQFWQALLTRCILKEPSCIQMMKNIFLGLKNFVDWKTSNHHIFTCMNLSGIDNLRTTLISTNFQIMIKAALSCSSFDEVIERIHFDSCNPSVLIALSTYFGVRVFFKYWKRRALSISTYKCHFQSKAETCLKLVSSKLWQ